MWGIYTVWVILPPMKTTLVWGIYTKWVILPSKTTLVWGIYTIWIILSRPKNYTKVKTTLCETTLYEELLYSQSTFDSFNVKRMMMLRVHRYIIISPTNYLYILRPIKTIFNLLSIIKVCTVTSKCFTS